MLATFCNLNGIKSKIFKKRKNPEYFPRYYLIPSINYKKLSVTSIKSNNKRLLLSKTKSIRDRRDKKENDKNSKLILTNDNGKTINYAEIKSFRSDIFSENFDNSGSAMTLINNSYNNNSNCKIEEIKSLQKNQNEDILITSKELEKSKEKMKSNNYLDLPKGKKIKSILKIKKTLANSQVENDSKKMKNSNFNSSKIQNINNSINEIFYRKINDEIYPGENFNININKDEIPNLKPNIIIKDINIKEAKEILPQTFINNVNIIGPNYLNPISDDIKRLESKIKELELEIKQKRYFNKLSISLSESIKINSSYENINKITNFNYISDIKLRNKTKDFLIQNMKIPIIRLNSKYNSSKFVSSVDEINYKNDNIHNSNNKAFMDSLSSSKVNSNYKGKISNDLINNFRKSLVFKNQVSQVENFKNKIKHLGYEKNNRNERTSLTIERSRTKNFGLNTRKKSWRF